MDLFITTIQSPPPYVKDLAQQASESLQAPYIPREQLSLVTLKRKYQADTIIVLTKNGPVVHTSGGDEYFFHLNMAELRIENLKNGKNDHMVTAMSLTAGMSVLDCTLGLATDAIVASFVVGEKGILIGLEVSPILAFVANDGLQHFTHEKKDVNEALRRIQVRNKHYHEILTILPTDSFDVVFFDPMFRQPIYSSSNLKPLRYLADHSPINENSFIEACRVAKKRVVIKEAAHNNEFARLGITTVYGGKYSSIHYGVYEVKG